MHVLLGRTAETAAVQGVLAAVRGGLTGVLVLRGEAGSARRRYWSGRPITRAGYR